MKCSFNDKEEQIKILTVVGARPQFVKAAMVSKWLKGSQKEVFVHTGQHYDYEMSKIFFEELDLPKPDYNLGVGSGSHAAQTANMLIKIEEVLLKEKPDMALLYGDTNSTLAATLAAVKLHIPIAHVEAGPRSYDMSIPEEVNRIVTDKFSRLLFCTSKHCVENLKKEGITKGVKLTGDVMFDAMKLYSKVADKKSKILKKLELKEKDYVFATVHRPSNTDFKKPLSQIIGAFNRLGKTVVFPAHPRTAKAIERFGLKQKIGKNILLIKPVGYIDCIALEKNASLIITDSGGMQKEAYFLKTPCITLRENTEWMELVRLGWNKLVKTDAKAIVNAANTLKRPLKYKENLFGNGNAGKKIARLLRPATCAGEARNDD